MLEARALLFGSVGSSRLATVFIYLSQQFSEDLKDLAIFISVIFVFLSLAFIPMLIKLFIVVGLWINHQLNKSSLNIH